VTSDEIFHVTRHTSLVTCDESEHEMYASSLGELQSILVGATRCLDCSDPRCANLCPEHVDVRAAMRLIVSRGNTRPAAWMQHADEATASAMRAIEASFELL